ncbi:hypothetical protein [Rhizobium sp. MHM7A]|uniref:hypothetical protein n=1 Tax=Rhizobium sp. MHM7A TaxID=2583233 RepID=UPI001105956B|nr:hypothetical protein [Rhizobium sp. MHM7A]TLX16232.1 hypothetical protein FFR93_02575 [Rhizobium sp. MHM7A]
MSAEKIKVKQITLIHSSGANDVGQGLANGVIAGTKEIVHSYEEADQVLAKWLATNLPGHYNDVDWVVTFEDGFQKFGSYNLGKPRDAAPEKPNFIDAITHNSLRLISDDPEHKGYQNFVDKDGKHRAMAQHVLDTYDHGLDDQPTVGMKL